MRIRELKLIRYGKFTDRHLELPRSSQDIHFIVGPNEAGKSTVRTAISDWLFSIPQRTSLAFLHPMPEMRLGGTLEAVGSPGQPGRELVFDRTKGSKNTLRTPADTILPDNVLQPWLGSLQEKAFNRMYALNHSALLEGSEGMLSAKDDLGRLLFQSAAGIEHLGDALKQLEVEADNLWAPRKSGSRAYYKAQEDYDEAHARFKQATLRTKDWAIQHEALKTTEQKLESARQRDAELRTQISRLERIRRVGPLLQSLDAAQLQRDSLSANGEVPLLEQGAAGFYGKSLRDLTLATADINRLRDEIAQLRLESEGQHVDRGILARADDITQLNELRLQFRAYRADMSKRRVEVAALLQQVYDLTRDLGWVADTEEALAQRLPAVPVRSRLRALLKSRAAVLQDLSTAQTRLDSCEQSLQAAQEDLHAVSAGELTPHLLAAVEEANRLGDHEALMEEIDQELSELHQRMEAALAGLGRWRQPVVDLQTMAAPDLATVQNLLDQLRKDQAEERAQQDALEGKGHEVAKLQRELQQLVRSFEPVSREQVLQARRVRDEAWQGLRQSPQDVAARAGAFEGHIATADTVADHRHDRAEHEAERQAKAAALDQQMAEEHAMRQRLEATRARIGRRSDEWAVLTSTCGLPQLPLELAPSWLQRRQTVLDLESERTQAERRRAADREAAERVRSSLWKELASRGTAEEPAALVECLRRANAQIRSHEQAQGQRKTLSQQIRDAQRSLPGLESAVQAAKKPWDEWNQSWRAAVLAAGYDPEVAVDQVDAEVEVMDKVEGLLDQVRDIRRSRIDAMQADLDGLDELAKELARRFDPELLEQSATDIALELTARLELARKAEEAALSLQERLVGKTGELNAACREQESLLAGLAPLMAAAGVQAVEDLGPAIERSDQRRAIEERIRSGERELADAGDALPLEKLREEAAGIGPDEVKAKLEGLKAQSIEVVAEIVHLGNEYGSRKQAFEAIDGADLAAQADSQRQQAVAAMADAAERYVKLQTASRLLKWSMEKYRQTKQGPMLAKASAIFSTLTLGSFSRLVVDSDEATPKLLGLRPSGQLVDISGMSEGSRDQLFLALRLAALELQADQGGSMPLIADDLFINFDDRRTAAGFEVLGQLSRKMQVVFLTHHDHLVPLARQVLGDGLNVVQL